MWHEPRDVTPGEGARVHVVRPRHVHQRDPLRHNHLVPANAPTWARFVFRLLRFVSADVEPRSARTRIAFEVCLGSTIHDVARRAVRCQVIVAVRGVDDLRFAFIAPGVIAGPAKSTRDCIPQRERARLHPELTARMWPASRSARTCSNRSVTVSPRRPRYQNVRLADVDHLRSRYPVPSRLHRARGWSG